LDHGAELWTSPVNIEEVVRGLRESEEAPARALFDGLRIAEIDSGIAWQAGTWRREHSRSGATLSQADCLIAAAAREVGATLATGNPRHFPIQELSVEHWEVGA
jgi:predicted nucleic acid-binding protein